MSNYFLEGDSFFVLKKLNELTNGKRINYNQDNCNGLSLIQKKDYSVYFDPTKETMESIKQDGFIICFMDKNVDLRIDIVKKLKSNSDYELFEPIPATDFLTLKKIFPNLINDSHLPTKNNPLKYKGQKQNYEWFDISLISDLYQLGDMSIYKEMFCPYIDIWSLTNDLWESNKNYILKSTNINSSNFENYFNRIRETSKDYIEVLQTSAPNFYKHKSLIPHTTINEYRFNKIKEKLNLVNGKEIYALECIENCLKNVRSGSNPKLELIKLFFNFKQCT